MQRARVLVVDDKESVLELMASILGDVHEVTTTPDPAQAVSLVERTHFDVVLTDVSMPVASGFDVLQAALRSSPATRVIMMTGYASIPDAVRAMRQGAFDYLPKPVEADEISLVVARALEQRQRPADAPSLETDFRQAVIAARDRTSREYLVALLREFGGNVTQAARKAGTTRESLHRLLRRYGVRSEDFKPAPR